MNKFITAIWKPGAFTLTLLLTPLIGIFVTAEEAAVSRPCHFKTDQLVAWCIVPFDAKSRGPVERAEMVKNLALRRVAYDWRAEHIPTFEQEIQEYQKRDIEFFAFWDWTPEIEPLIQNYNIHPQIWKIAPSPNASTQEEKVRRAGEALKPLTEKAISLGCELGIYNHGGWSGDPANMVAICQWLRKELQSDKIGIVYNQHHGHEHIPTFQSDLQLMMPYLFCLNLNGMNQEPNPKILPLGEGTEDAALMEIILGSGYEGPIGILDHRPEMDSELSLRQNLEGLNRFFSSKN